MSIRVRSALERLILPPSAEPTAPVDGELWDDTATGRLKRRVAGAWRQLAETGDAPTAHTHPAADVNSGVLDLARLPVAASGVSSATQVVRADDSRLTTQDTGWIGLPLLNGWVNYNASVFSTAAYRKRDGVVYLRGLVQGNARTGDVIANLPAGFRHNGLEQLWSGNSNTSTSRVDTWNDGNVAYMVGGVDFISLSQIIYPADQ